MLFKAPSRMNKSLDSVKIIALITKSADSKDNVYFYIYFFLVQ